MSGLKEVVESLPGPGGYWKEWKWRKFSLIRARLNGAKMSAWSVHVGRFTFSIIWHHKDKT